MRDIRCDILTGEHDENGDLKSLNLVHQVIVHLLQQERHTRIRSELIEIEFTPGGDSLKQVRIPFSADVHHANGTEFSATAGRMDFAFRDGELAQWSGNGNAELRGKDFSCRGDTIEFDAPRSLIRVKAEQSRVIRDKDVFHAPIFSMHSEKKWLRGEKGVRATFHPRNAQPPFSENPFFIRSEKMLLMDENDTTQFSGNVQLIQDNTRLSAETLNMQAGKSLTASKNVKLAFQSQDEQLSAWGDTLIFDPGKKTLVIKGKGGMQSAETRLNAEALILSFLDDRKLGTISAEGAIRFEKGDISGGSERVWWDFLRRSMRFSGKAVLEKKGGGKAEGESLEMDLETDNIRIQSRGDQRTSTVLEQ
jgi:lipopolysaccharide export system protein LptA